MIVSIVLLLAIFLPLILAVLMAVELVNIVRDKPTLF